MSVVSKLGLCRGAEGRDLGHGLRLERVDSLCVFLRRQEASGGRRQMTFYEPAGDGLYHLETKGRKINSIAKDTKMTSPWRVLQT